VIGELPKHERQKLAAIFDKIKKETIMLKIRRGLIGAAVVMTDPEHEGKTGEIVIIVEIGGRLQFGIRIENQLGFFWANNFQFKPEEQPHENEQ
jgi:hypothetical protein